MEITQTTNDFIAKVNMLIEQGRVKNYSELVDILDWNLSMLSDVMNGRRNVPKYIVPKLRKFLPDDDTFDTPVVADLRNNLTLEFQNTVKKLVSNNVFKNPTEVANALNWSSSTMSEVMTGKRPVPYKIAARLKQLAGSMNMVAPKFLPPNSIDLFLQQIDLSADVLIKQLFDVKKEVTKLREILAGVSTPAPGNGQTDAAVTHVLNNRDRTLKRRLNNKND